MKLKETITAPIAVLFTYLLYFLCFATDVASDALARYGDYSLISGIVLTVMTLVFPAVFYAKLKGTGYSVRMRFLSFHPSRLVFALCMLICALSGVVLLSIGLHEIGFSDAKYSLVGHYELSLSEKEIPIFLRCIAYAVIPAFAEEFLYRGVLITEYRESGFGCALLFSSLLFTLGQFSVVSAPAFFFVGVVMGVVFYVTDSLPVTIVVRLIFNVLVFFFEDATWTLILKRSDFVFFLSLCAVVFLLFTVLGLSEAQRIYYTKGIDGEKTPPEGKLKDKAGKRLLSAALSPTLIICVAAAVAITLFTRG